MSRPAGALHRLERILTMVPWLLSNPGVTLGEISERFDVPREELTEDLDILGYCGLPGYGGGDLVEVTIHGDRVSVRMADFFSRPVTLSMREAVTLLLSARALSSIEGLAESAALRSAVATLEEALGSQAARVKVDLGTEGDQWLSRAREAVAQRAVVHLVYRSASKAQTTERDVEPWGVVGAGGAWYLQGYCRAAKGPRDFRLDRVKDLRLTDERAPAPPPDQPAPPVYRPEAGDTPVTLDLQPGAWWVAEWAVVDADDTNRSVRRVTLRTPTLEWAARLVLQLGGQAGVVSPPELVQRVQQLAKTTLAGYAEAGS